MAELGKTKIEEYADEIEAYCNSNIAKLDRKDNLEVKAVYSESKVPIEGRMTPRFIANKVKEDGTRITIPLINLDIAESYLRYKDAKGTETEKAVYDAEMKAALDMALSV